MDFTDEEGLDDFSSHEGEYKELTHDQLRRLQVDRFPSNYAYNFDEPTQDQTDLMGRRKKAPQQESFNVDSFLNSDHVHMQYNIKQSRRRK